MRIQTACTPSRVQLLVSALFGMTIAIWVVPALAQAPRSISHQGVLLTSLAEPVPDANYSVDFAIYDVAGGGSPLWSQTKSVATVDGVFNTTLGPIADVDFNQSLWLGVTVESDAEMTPRTVLTSVPSAFGLVHPYKAVVDTSAAAIWIENQGSGDAALVYNRGSGTAGAFIVADPGGLNENSGVFGQSDAKGSAVYGLNSGTGNAGKFVVSNAGSEAAALYVQNDGKGLGIHSVDTVKIETADLNLQTSGLLNEDMIIEAEDAMIGLYSDGAGTFGSGIQLGEINFSGALEDKWSIVRGANAAGADLKFTYGEDRSYGVNPVRVKVDTVGNLTASNYVFAIPDTQVVSLSWVAFQPAVITAGVTWISNYMAAGTVSEVFAPVSFPNGATIIKLGCEFEDTSGTYNIGCVLKRYVSGSIDDLAMASTTGTPGLVPVEDASISNPVVDNYNGAYWVSVASDGDWANAGGDLVLVRVWIEYTVTSAG